MNGLLFNISVLLDVQANLPETSPFFVCQNGFGEHLFSNVYSTWCTLHRIWIGIFFHLIFIINITTNLYFKFLSQSQENLVLSINPHKETKFYGIYVLSNQKFLKSSCELKPFITTFYHQY